MKSGKIRSANVIKPGDQCCLCAAVSQSDNCNLIQVTSTTDHPKIFIGRKYTKSSSGKIVLHSGKTSLYAQLSSAQHPNSEVSPTELRSRCDYVMKLVSLISGSEEEEERELLFVKIMKRNFSFFQRTLKQSGKNFFDNIISVKNAVELRLVLQMPTYMFRRLRNCLSTLGFPIFCFFFLISISSFLFLFLGGRGTGITRGQTEPVGIGYC